MQADSLPHDFRLHDLADDYDHDIQDNQRDAVTDIALHERNDRPWQEDRAGSDNRHNIKYRDNQRDQNGLFIADQQEPDGKLRKREEQDDGVGFCIVPKDIPEASSCRAENGNGLFRKMFF